MAGIKGNDLNITNRSWVDGAVIFAGSLTPRSTKMCKTSLSMNKHKTNLLSFL